MTFDFSPTSSVAHRTLKRVGLISFVWMLTALLSVALAQAAGSDLLAPYRDFKPAEDMATRVMEGLLGPTYTSPLTSGLTTNTLFGSIFLIFNIIVFAVGTVWASYGVIAGIVQTAHEGVVLGKRMSAVWMPVRMVTGIGGLVPAFGGFSLSQVAMIIATSWGISFANYAYNEAITQSANFSTLINSSFIRTDPAKDSSAMANALFRQRILELEYNSKKQDYEALGQTVPPADVLKVFPFDRATHSPQDMVFGRAVGVDGDMTRAYAVGIKRKFPLTALGGEGESGVRSGQSALGFRSTAVDYAAISSAAWDGYAYNFPAFVDKIKVLAERYYKEKKTGERVNGQQVLFPKDEIRSIGVWYSGMVRGTDVNGRLIKEDALRNMTKYGFFSAGSFYSTHAEVSAAVLQAADVTDFVIVMPSGKGTELSSGEYDSVSSTPEESVGSSSGFTCIDGKSSNEPCSLGQKLVQKMIGIGVNGAGGSALVVDPIIALKNIGDYMMVIGETILSMGAIIKVASAVGSVVAPVLTAAGVLGAPLTGGASSALAAGGMTMGLLATLGNMAPYIGGLLFAIGALCSLYIPMVPFINWVSALVQYCCIVVESFAAAPLWALAHLQADGEGMGQRTEKGYLYLLNLLFRPILMVVAFFAASALVILLGSVVMQMYLPTIAAVQGNSVTGIFSAIGFVFLFFIIMNIIIQGLFHLVMELADDAIGWVGGIGRSSIGRDTEGKVSNMFMMGGRFVGSGIASAGVGKMTGAGSGGPVSVAKPGSQKVPGA